MMERSGEVTTSTTTRRACRSCCSLAEVRSRYRSRSTIPLAVTAAQPAKIAAAAVARVPMISMASMKHSSA
ncbi:hypothetical protein BW733_14555 [Tessaracoccus flavescens]|uniref:Uncharacterized protein n=1 Tax=Tessaracoccus flavescens TaxID=399497 RepID=A0A1Q2D0S2_9ACTN|nr:hypothetical protein BW733_14555 [Tessaracoccus flavescens]